MKLLFRVSALMVFAAATQAVAAFQSARFDPDNRAPEFPLQLESEGVIEGRAVLAVSIDPEGRITDVLPLAYTHLPFVDACLSAIKAWKIAPATVNGEPVSVQMQLTFNFGRHGFVESDRVIVTNHFLRDRFTVGTGGRLVYQVQLGSELDRMPAVVRSVAPVYPQPAAEDGRRGRVRVNFYIDEQGAVRLPSVTNDSAPYLSNLAIAALRQWRFEPPTRHGIPVLTAASQEFNFGSAE